jgi:hypothetical protein
MFVLQLFPTLNPTAVPTPTPSAMPTAYPTLFPVRRSTFPKKLPKSPFSTRIETHRARVFCALVQAD